MAEITRERSGTLIRKVFEVLKDHPDGLQARKVLAEVENQVALTPFEESTYPSNPKVRRFEKIVRFATIGPVKAGWLVKDRGEWQVTEDGQAAYVIKPIVDKIW